MSTREMVVPAIGAFSAAFAIAMLVMLPARTPAPEPLAANASIEALAQPAVAGMSDAALDEEFSRMRSRDDRRARAFCEGLRDPMVEQCEVYGDQLIRITGDFLPGEAGPICDRARSAMASAEFLWRVEVRSIWNVSLAAKCWL